MPHDALDAKLLISRLRVTVAAAMGRLMTVAMGGERRLEQNDGDRASERDAAVDDKGLCRVG